MDGSGRVNHDQPPLTAWIGAAAAWVGVVTGLIVSIFRWGQWTQSIGILSKTVEDHERRLHETETRYAANADKLDKILGILTADHERGHRS